MEKDKLIIDGKDYGNDYTAYCRAYNNRLRDMFIMKQLHEIPIRQPKRRPQIKRYRTINYCSNSERIHKILAYVFAYLVGFILFLYAFISLISF
tara:strand:- start:65 stop:346 length:282 start_codon:yes stop_codon:yes gene_type:complete